MKHHKTKAMPKKAVPSASLKARQSLFPLIPPQRLETGWEEVGSLPKLKGDYFPNISLIVHSVRLTMADN